MTAHERLEFMRGVVIAKMKLHPNDKTFVRFNAVQLMALIDVAMAVEQSSVRTLPMDAAIQRLADT